MVKKKPFVGGFMKKQLFKESGAMFLALFLPCLINLLVMDMAVRFADMIVEIDYFSAVVIRLVVSVIVVAGAIGAITYMLSYHTAEFNTKGSLLRLSLATVLQLALCLLLKFHPSVGGGVVYLAGIFEHGTGFSSGSDIVYIGIIDYLLAFFVISAVYFLTLVICGRMGVRVRLHRREDLTTKKNTEL